MNDEIDAPYKDGWRAHRNGVDIEANPYNELSQSYSHEQWVSGWCRRFGAIKHDSLEEEL